ncbi:hypothetical protein HA402_003964 [Bradysia odoriphaga]|nr:hypothetical protein HA402_003964 [Bradysia odoriphaga]
MPKSNNVNDGRFDETERPPQLRCIDKYERFALCRMSARYTVAFMAMMGFIISFGMRGNFSLAKFMPPLENVHWTVYEEWMMNFSFYWGYLLASISGGILATVYPAYRIFGIAICISAILSMTIPGWVMLGNVVVLILIRFSLGLVEGVILPACLGIWRFWSPPQERSRLPTIAFCGTFAGIMIGGPMYMALVQRVSWQAPFYLYSMVGVFWYLAWLWLVFEKPQNHPTISVEEKEYIEKSLGENTSTVTKSSIPFRRIVISAPVYAIIVVNFCRSWFSYTVLIYQDLFMKGKFNYVVSSEGTALSYLIMTLSIPIGGILADCLLKSGKMSTTNVRKLFTCGGFGAAFSGLAISGYIANHLDISPKYASILMGLSNGIGSLAGFVSPTVTNYIIFWYPGIDAMYAWPALFIIPAIVNVFGVIFYGIFASGELQPWAGPRADSRTIRNPNEGGCPTEGIALARL